jgi:hypothetical protein
MSRSATVFKLSRSYCLPFRRKGNSDCRQPGYKSAGSVKRGIFSATTVSVHKLLRRRKAQVCVLWEPRTDT